MTLQSPVAAPGERRPWLAVGVALLLVLAAGWSLLLGMVAGALAGCCGANDRHLAILPISVGTTVALALLVAAVGAFWGHRGRWWVPGFSALAPLTGAVLAWRSRELPLIVVVVVVCWLALLGAAQISPLKQWWSRRA